MTSSRKPNSCDSAESATVWRPHNPDTPQDPRQADREATRNSPELPKRRQGSRRNLCRQPHAPMLYRAYFAVMRMSQGMGEVANEGVRPNAIPSSKAQTNASDGPFPIYIDRALVRLGAPTRVHKPSQAALRHDPSIERHRCTPGAQGAQDSEDSMLTAQCRKTPRNRSARPSKAGHSSAHRQNRYAARVAN